MLGFNGRGSGRGKEEIFKKLPSTNWREDISEKDLQDIEGFVANELGLTPLEQERFLKFLKDKAWSGVAKTLERSDWPMTAIQAAGKWLAVESARQGELAVALSKSSEFEDLMNKASQEHQSHLQAPQIVASNTFKKGGENVIYYGAPGTGKSYTINEVVKSRKYVVRTELLPIYWTGSGAI